jgi:hypothetical protein
MNEPTFSIIKNADALAINQDVWGQQARRIASAVPKSVAISAPDHAVVLAVKCAATPTDLQLWRLANVSGAPSPLYTVDSARRPGVVCELRRPHQRCALRSSVAAGQGRGLVA